LKTNRTAWRSIRFRIHPLFVIVWVIAALSGMFLEATTLFVIVLIHELGHVWTAISYGWRVEEVELLPFGGVAKVSEYGNVSPWEEIVVAFAGPLNNGLMVWMAYFFSAAGWWGTEWTEFFIQANLMIGLFNLLPILPLDGGKIAQALLSLALPYMHAVRISIIIGFLCSCLLLIYGFGLPILDKIHINAITIGVFLFYGNVYALISLPILKIRFFLQRQHWGKTQLVQGGSSVPIYVSSNHTLEQTLKMFWRNRYHLVYLIDDMGKIRRVITEQSLIDAYFKGNPGKKVFDLFVR
jgi:stage IV sporulation protein FB